MFNGTEGEWLDPATAQRWINNYENAEPFATKALFYGKEPMTTLLNQNPQVVGFRVYYAKDDYEGWRLIFVAVDADGNNLGPVSGGGQGLLMDGGIPCPPWCPK